MLEAIAWAAAEFSGSEAREVVEALLDLKPSRLYVGRDRLDRLDLAASRFGFGLDVGGRKYVLNKDPNSDWSDTICASVPLTAEVGLYAAYVGNTQGAAELARKLDEAGAHDEFGKLLRVPACCISSFTRQWGSQRESFHALEYLTAESKGDRIRHISWQNNVLGQFFGKCLISYLPCSLTCRSTRDQVEVVLREFNKASPEIAQDCLEGHKHIYVRTGVGAVIELPAASSIDALLAEMCTNMAEACAYIPSEC